MTWTASFMPEPRAGGPLPQPPEDGILAAAHAPGRLGLRWARLMEAMPTEARDRVARGRNHARRGRVRALEVGPGAATAEVIAEVEARPVLRVRAFHRHEWDVVLTVLRAELDLLAGLLEGELPDRLLERLEAEGVQLLPGRKDVGFDCDCGDFVMPCAHAAAVGHLLGDVIDGDPFQLLALRGRTRDQIIADLREGWGDQAMYVGEARDEDPPSDLDWLSSPGGVPDFACSIAGGGLAAAGGGLAASGLRALGPVPGAADLVPALAPLYEAGGRAALAVIEAAQGDPGPRRGRGRGDGAPTASPWAALEPVVEAHVRPQGPQVVDDAASAEEDVGTRRVEAPAEAPAAPPEPACAPAASESVEVAPAEEAAPVVVAPAVPQAPEDPLLVVLEGGPRSTQELMQELGLRTSEVRRRLAELLRTQRIERLSGPKDTFIWRLVRG